MSAEDRLAETYDRREQDVTLFASFCAYCEDTKESRTNEKTNNIFEFLQGEYAR